MKSLISKELIFLDLPNNVARFYKLDLNSVGFNKIQLVSTYGNMNGSGRSSLKSFDGEKAFDTSRKLFYSKMFELKSQGYIEKEDFLKWHSLFDENYLEKNTSIIKEHITDKKEQKKFNKKHSISNKSYFECSLCKKKIKESLYNKINEWGRGEGKWDENEDFVGYKSVLCIDCQIEHDIFKKKR